MSNFRFCPYLKFPTVQFQTLQLPACLTWYFLLVTCPPCLWEISCIEISERYGMLWKSFTSRSSVVPHKGLALALQFFSCLRIPIHRISSGMVGTSPIFFSLDPELEFLCIIRLVFQHHLSCRPASVSHPLFSRKGGLADTFLQLQL